MMDALLIIAFVFALLTFNVPAILAIVVFAIVWYAVIG